MRIPRLLLVVLVGLSPLVWARSAEKDRDLYVLGIALNQEGEPGSWVGVGAANAWKRTRAGAILDDRLYTAENDGTLRATNLDTGDRRQIGKPEFGATTLMFADSGKLYTIETDGSLFQINPNDGSWGGIGAAAAWKLARAGAVLEHDLYTVETDATLQAANLRSGERKQIGKAEFGSTAFLFAEGGKLFAIETGGSLFQVDPKDGSRSRLGPAKAWKGARAGALLKGRLYDAESDGTLQETNLGTGVRTAIGKTEFGSTTFMFAKGNDLYTIEADGSLYRVFVQPAASIDDYNWCPQEIEKVFREQGKAFYGNLHSRLVLGKQATHQGVMNGLDWVRKCTTPKDLVVMYVGCHGFLDPKEGWGVGTADGQTLWGHEIKAELAKLPCQVLILIETCTSGGFARAHKNDPPVPANVTALCACSGKQSTDNQLDIAVAEALYGRADFNKDGVVDLDELIRYIELRYKEWWPDPKKAEDRETPVLVKAKTLAGSLPLTNVSADLAAVVHDGSIWSALLEKKNGDQYQVHLLGWSSTPGPYFRTNTVARNFICLPGDGRPLLVEQNGVWYPARLLNREGAKYNIHYLGYDEDEVVTRERIKYPFVGQP